MNEKVAVWAVRHDEQRGSLSGPVLTCGGARQAPRWRAGERLEQLFERRCDLPGAADRIAVDADGLRLTFGELDTWANQLARHLRALGVTPGDRVPAGSRWRGNPATELTGHALESRQP